MDKELINIIRDYIKNVYYVDKLKDGTSKHFKRGVIIDNDTVMYMLKNDRSEIRKKVYASIKRIFYVDDEVITEAMNDYLIKK